MNSLSQIYIVNTFISFVMPQSAVMGVNTLEESQIDKQCLI